MAWLAVNKDNEFLLFSMYPYRYDEPIFINTGEFEEDRYGYYPIKKFSGNYNKVWKCGSDIEFLKWGYKINKENLSKELQTMTWEDNPIEL